MFFPKSLGQNLHSRNPKLFLLRRLLHLCDRIFLSLPMLEAREMNHYGESLTSSCLEKPMAMLLQELQPKVDQLEHRGVLACCSRKK